MFCPARIQGAAVFALAALLAVAPAFARGGFKEHSLVGTIQKADGQKLTVETSQGVESVSVGSGCVVRRSGKVVPAEQLAGEEGSRVKVRYIEDGGTKRATSVTLAARK